MNTLFKRNKHSQGFTLIELLVVIAIISILAVTVFVALDPVKRFQDSRNARRTTDVNNILTATHQYIVDNGGSLPSGFTASMSATQLGTCGSGGATLCPGAAAACVNLSSSLARYLKSMPRDPENGTAATTGYSVSVDANNLITVTACGAEGGATIEAAR